MTWHTDELRSTVLLDWTWPQRGPFLTRILRIGTFPNLFPFVVAAVHGGSEAYATTAPAALAALAAQPVVHCSCDGRVTVESPVPLRRLFHRNDKLFQTDIHLS